MLASTGASPDIRYFGEQSDPTQAAAAPEPLGDTLGAPRSGRGDAIELLLRGKSDAQHWVSPDTRASVLAPYLADWKRKVERVGTLNFPSAARAGLSGSPVVEVEIAADGRLRRASVRRSSGYGALDQAALTILRLASPFNPFPADARGGIFAPALRLPVGLCCRHPTDARRNRPRGGSRYADAAGQWHRRRRPLSRPLAADVMPLSDASSNP